MRIPIAISLCLATLHASFAALVIRGPVILPTASATCSTLRDNSDADITGAGTQNANTLYFANKIVVTASYDVCRVDINAARNSGDANDWRIQIYSQSGTDTPDVVIGTSADLPNASIPTVAAWISFTFPTPVSVVNTSNYWIVINRNSGGGAISWLSDNGSPERVMSSNDGAAWSSVTTTRACNFRLYSL